MKNGLTIDKYGTKRWYKNGLLHNENGPAVKHTNGDKVWYINGKRHRLDCPAIEYSDQQIECSSQEEFEKIISHKLNNKSIKGTKKQMNSFIETAKSDIEKAAYITAANQFTLLTKEGILAAAKTTLNGDQLAMLSKFLDSDLGKSALSYMLGQGLPLAPVIGQDPRIIQVAESMRINGIANGMNMLMGIVMAFVMPGIMKAMESLPSLKKNSIETTGQEVPAEAIKIAKTSKKKATKVRVSASKKEVLQEEDEIEEPKVKKSQMQVQ